MLANGTTETSQLCVQLSATSAVITETGAVREVANAQAWLCNCAAFKH